MPAYIYATGEVTDPVAYEQYREKVPAIIAAYGGRYLVRGGASEVLEGDGVTQRQVILEFPNMERLKAFYGSAEYAPLMSLRRRASTIRLLAIEGV